MERSPFSFPIGLEALTAVVMNISVFCNITFFYSPLKDNKQMFLEELVTFIFRVRWDKQKSSLKQAASKALLLCFSRQKSLVHFYCKDNCPPLPHLRSRERFSNDTKQFFVFIPLLHVAMETVFIITVI